MLSMSAPLCEDCGLEGVEQCIWIFSVRILETVVIFKPKETKRAVIPMASYAQETKKDKLRGSRIRIIVFLSRTRSDDTNIILHPFPRHIYIYIKKLNYWNISFWSHLSLAPRLWIQARHNFPPSYWSLSGCPWTCLNLVGLWLRIISLLIAICFNTVALLHVYHLETNRTVHIA